MPITELDITGESAFADGEAFGDVGAYTLLEGTARFAIDPVAVQNRAITDVQLAPRDDQGRVRFSADFAMLQPADPKRGNRRLLFDVMNRGRKTVLGNFNGVESSLDHTAPLRAGNGFLMRHGYTVVWCAWQADVPPTPGLMGLTTPQPLGPGGAPLTGGMMLWFQVNEPTQVHMLSDRQHLPTPPADIDEPDATLFVRDHPNRPMEPIDRDKWSFVRVEGEDVEPEPSHVYMPSGFEPGRIYQLVYTAKGSRIVGLGFAAVRDSVSFLKHGAASDGNPCAGGIDRAYAFGSSQSGRFLRQLIHTGMNEDEEGRMALDGIIPHIAGGMRGEFNLRFGQPSKDICYVIPEMFPFTDTEQSDPVTGKSGSMLARLRDRDVVPKIMFTNTSAEYWRGDAALIHTDLETMTDAPEDSEFVRRYHFAGTQHGTGLAFPPTDTRPADGVRAQLPYNSVDYAPLHRASLVNLDRWVTTGDPAPASRHPSFSDGTAVESHALLDRFRTLPGVPVAPETTRAIRLDYGPETHLGRATTLPPVEGETYPAVVSDVDADLNETGGIPLPDLTAPLATYTGWNLRHPDVGNPDLYIGVTGGLAGWTLPFAPNAAEREASGDLRPSIDERYESKESYLQQVQQVAQDLIDDGYLLAEDLQDVVDRAALKYDHFAAPADGTEAG